MHENCNIDGAVKSANWHLTSECNYNCIFCYTQKMSGEMQSLAFGKKILHNLQNRGIEKINFVGGEPLCSPLIFDLCEIAKKTGFTTSIVTNGSLIDEKVISKFDGNLDWVGLSVDSSSEKTEKKLGRGTGNHIKNAINASELLHNSGIRLKVNTTVTKLNFEDDMTEIISLLSPERWKIFQFLHIIGQNDSAVKLLEITTPEFEIFKNKNKNLLLKNGRNPVFESADDMIDSYLMISPAGNLVLNSNHKYQEIPIDNLNSNIFSEIIDFKKYYTRGGIYDWN